MKQTATHFRFYALSTMTICAGLGTLGMSYDSMDELVRSNRAPELTRVELQNIANTSETSDAQKVVCAAASDPDGHAVHFEWILVGSGAPVSAPQVIRNTSTAQDYTECVSLTLSVNGDYKLLVAAYDGIEDPQTGRLVFIEDYFVENGIQAASHDELSLPLSTDIFARGN